MSTAGQGQSMSGSVITQTPRASLLNVQGFISPLSSANSQPDTLCSCYSRETHCCCSWGTWGVAVSQETCPVEGGRSIADNMLHVHGLKMGISYKEKEHLCIRETKILVDRMKVYTACREIIKMQVEKVKLDLKTVPETSWIDQAVEAGNRKLSIPSMYNFAYCEQLYNC